MAYEYSDASRADDAYALPDVEVFYLRESERATLCEMEGEIHTEQPSTRRPCEDCPEAGFYFAFGFPGCMWDGEPIGPYATYDEALAAAREECES